MAVSINTNASSLSAQRNLAKSGSALATSMERLSTGMRINGAKDDAAGLQISNRMTSQINGLNVARRNANDGISMAQTAEGALQESTNILQRMRDLSLQSANASNSAEDRKSLQKEMSALSTELTRIAETTTFGGQNLLDGSFGTKQFQIGADANQTIGMTTGDMRASKLGQSVVDFGGTAVSTLSSNAAAVANGVDAQTLTISGDSGQDTVALAGGESAKDIAAAVNGKSASTGVSAEAFTAVRLSGLTSPTDNSGTELTIDSGSGAKTYTIADDAGIDTIAGEINKNTEATGIRAVANDDGSLDLIAENGEDIVMSVDSVAGDATGMTMAMTELDKDLSTNGGATANLAAATANARVVGQVELSTTGETLTATSTTGTVTTGAETVDLKTIADIDITDATKSQNAIATIDAAIAQVDNLRSDLGAVQNRFDHTISNLSNIEENISASRGRIRDTDFASETANMTKNQILQQAGTSILAQANQLPQSALSLIG